MLFSYTFLRFSYTFPRFSYTFLRFKTQRKGEEKEKKSEEKPDLEKPEKRKAPPLRDLSNGELFSYTPLPGGGCYLGGYPRDEATSKRGKSLAVFSSGVW